MPPPPLTFSTSLLCLTSFICVTLLSHNAAGQLSLDSCSFDEERLQTLRHQTKTMFYHAFDSYMQYAFPKDELLPLSCTGENSFGGISMTLIDTLDSFVVFRDWPRFVSSAKYLRNNFSFDVNDTISVFETTIRVLGGLLSAHGFLTDAARNVDFDVAFWYPHYDDALLRLAVDVADRIMPAFNTPTGIPYGAVHLLYGVMPDESIHASTAGAGSLLLEFGTLTRYTGNARYYNAAFNAMSALHGRAAQTGLVGNHINIIDGEWVATLSGVGGLVDSFYEYMLKGYVLFGDARLLHMFDKAYNAIQKHIYLAPWYLDVDMWSGHTVSSTQSSLSAFFPGLQVLTGRLREATETVRAHYSVWRRYGCLPEGYEVDARAPTLGQVNYPLRPELIESMFYLHWATNDSSWIGAAANIAHTLEVVARVPCGYSEIRNAETLEKGDSMPSFLMSETLKYLFLIFGGRGEDGGVHWSRSGEFVFTTEAHPLRIATREFGELLKGGGDGGDGEFVMGVGTARRKCGRRKRWEEVLACGYGMAGTDYPRGDVRSKGEDALPAEIERQVQAVTLREGAEGLRIGRVFVGDSSSYRVVRVEGQHVFFSLVSADGGREEGGGGEEGGEGDVIVMEDEEVDERKEIEENGDLAAQGGGKDLGRSEWMKWLS